MQFKHTKPCKLSTWNYTSCIVSLVVLLTLPVLSTHPALLPQIPHSRQLCVADCCTATGTNLHSRDRAKCMWVMAQAGWWQQHKESEVVREDESERRWDSGNNNMGLVTKKRKGCVSLTKEKDRGARRKTGQCRSPHRASRELHECHRLRLCHPTSRGDQMQNLQVHQVHP